jgi:hypothetical protein
MNVWPSSRSTISIQKIASIWKALAFCTTNWNVHEFAGVGRRDLDDHGVDDVLVLDLRPQNLGGVLLSDFESSGGLARNAVVMVVSPLLSDLNSFPT